MLYAKQISPEYQESPLFICPESFPEDIAVCGNRHLIEHTPEVFNRVREALENGELAEALEDLKTSGYYSDWYKNPTAAINDMLYPEKPKYSTRDIHALKQLVTGYGERGNDERETLCAVLSIVTGEKWAYRSINGCCQGDWNYIYYPVDRWSREALDAFEIEYFNMGTEWIIHDEDGEPTDAEQISGYSVYCVAQDEDGIIKELADASGEPVEGAVLFAFDGYTQTPKYRKVG